jgi:hypothetical protein
MPDSGAVRQARYRATAKGRAADNRWKASPARRALDARTNARRIFVGRTYVGTENTYPAPREAVAQFARELIEQHKEAHGTDG